MLLAVCVLGWHCHLLRHLRRTCQSFRCSSLTLPQIPFFMCRLTTLLSATAFFIAFRPCLPLPFTKFAAYKLTIVLQMDSITDFSLHPLVCTAILLRYVRFHSAQTGERSSGLHDITEVIMLCEKAGIILVEVQQPSMSFHLSLVVRQMQS